MTGPGAVTIMNRSVPAGTHICAFYSGPAGRDELVMPFLAEGIVAGHKCICILESLGPAEVLARLGRERDPRVSVGRCARSISKQPSRPATIRVCRSR